MNLEEKKEGFVSKFQNLENKYNINSLIDAFGVSSIIEDEKFSDKASIITIYINTEQLQNNIDLKNLRISATYGVRAETGGVYLGDNSKISNPIDLTSDDYFYDINDGRIMFKNKELSAKELINRIYDLHKLPTKKFKGFFIRFRLFIWRILFFNFYRFISTMFHYFLYLISGDKYLYHPVFSREIVNGRTISSSIDSMIDDTMPQISEGKKVDFLGYKIDIWPIVFYSIFNIIIYFIFEFKNIKPVVLVKIFNNNFLLALYVVISLWFIDVVIPKIFKSLIKYNSERAFNTKHKRLKI